MQLGDEIGRENKINKSSCGCNSSEDPGHRVTAYSRLRGSQFSNRYGIWNIYSLKEGNEFACATELHVQLLLKLNRCFITSGCRYCQWPSSAQLLHSSNLARTLQGTDNEQKKIARRLTRD